MELTISIHKKNRLYLLNEDITEERLNKVFAKFSKEYFKNKYKWPK